MLYTHSITGNPDPGEYFSDDFSVSGALFLGVVGALLAVIIMMTIIVSVVICSSVKSKCAHRGHSIGGEKLIMIEVLGCVLHL